jgi:ubiquinone/menaquinone biosynthesis C-methylase UbiE
MPDVWTSFADLDPATQDRLADVLEVRGAAPAQQTMRHAFLGGLDLPGGARVLDVGCGTGTLTRMLGRRAEVGSVIGIDPAAVLIERARALTSGLEQVAFREGDGRALPFPDATFDAVTFDSVLSHASDARAMLAEAARVLRPGGQLAIFDGDYSTATVASAAHDPLQACVDAMMASSVNDRWIVRRLPALVRGVGFDAVAVRSHGFAEVGEASYMLTIVDRGADILRSAGTIADATAAALKAEARRRVETRSFFGHIAYASLVARTTDRCAAS